MYILTRKEMTAIDKYTIEEYQIPARLLMELAGKGCFDFIFNKLPLGSTIAIFCGTGNNGGDGFVIVRWLKNYGYEPIIFVLGNLNKMSAETEANYNLAKKIDVLICEIDDNEKWNEIKEKSFSFDRIPKAKGKGFDAYVDAIFGINFRGNLPPLIKDIIDFINKQEGLKIAVDIASGLDANNGSVATAFKADYTLTMAAPKYGHYLGKGKEYSGEIVAIDIGVPNKVWQEKKPMMKLITAKEINFPPRCKYFHKTDYGRVAVIAGSRGYTGAAILACRAALKSGAGLITLLHPQGLDTIFETSLIEVMTRPFNYSDDTELPFEELNKNDVLLIGPGLGLSEEAVALVEAATRLWHKPAVYDADALNILAAHPDWLERLRGKPALLTPHMGEFSRLSGLDIQTILDNPIDTLINFIEKYQTATLLKDSYRLYADEENLLLDASGNDGLATGGSGDCLAGIIVSFLGQKSSIKDAAVSGSYLLGSTAEYVANQYMTQAITPSMIIESLFKKL